MLEMRHDEFLDESGPQDRRKESRTAAVYRSVLIETEDFTGFCLLRNLSCSGMMGVAYTQFAEGEAVNVQFVPGHVVSGTIIWSRGGRIGVEFDQEIDLVASLSNMGSQYIDTRVNRAPRLTIRCEGHAQIDGHVIDIQVQDISQRGIKAIIPSIAPGEEVTLHLPGMEARKAVVRWSQSDLAGLNFVRPIAFEALARWAIERQSEAELERAYA